MNEHKHEPTLDDEPLGSDARPAAAATIEDVERRPARPTYIISSEEIPEEPGQYPGSTEILSYGRPIGAAAGLQRLGLHVERLPPGHRTSFPHAHEDEEEFVYVLEGEVDAWVDGALHRMVAGDLAAFPAGTGIAHTFVNNSERQAILLAGGERSRGKSRIAYPHNSERRQPVRERWWDDAPQRRVGAWPPHAHAGRGEVTVLETDRLALRWWELSDAEAMFRVFGDPAAHQFSGATPYANVAAARTWLERELVAAPARGFGHWAVVERDSQEVVGSCGFRAGSGAEELELGFTIGASHWGRGYATEVAGACLRYGIEQLRASNVLALTMPDNVAARRVLEKIGLSHRGNEEHDGVRWCVYEVSARGGAFERVR